jgi:hypothetical protein
METLKEEKVVLAVQASSKIIALVILLITLVFAYGCGVDQLWVSELAKAKAGNENVVRVDYENDSATYIIIDNDCNIRRLFYSGFLVTDKPVLRNDKILFTIENCDPTKVFKRLKLDVDE